MSTTVLQSSDSVTIGVHTLPVWPKDQKVQNWRNTSVLVTQFADHKFYAPALRSMALERSTDAMLAHQFE